MHSSSIQLEAVRPTDGEVAGLFDAFIREADGPLEIGLDLEAEIAAGPPSELAGPHGVLLLARVDGEPAGLGGVRYLDTQAAEIKTMFVSPAHRGKGVARAILAELERIAREHDCRRLQLDTSDYLTGAIALYRAAGYRQSPPYNQNPKANLWFERAL
jgi:GNAT superfamily N-acetyltransferase